MIDPELAIFLSPAEEETPLLSSADIKYAGDSIIAEVMENFPHPNEEKNIQTNFLINYYLDPPKKTQHIKTAIEALKRLKPSQQRKICCCLWWQPQSPYLVVQDWIRQFNRDIEGRAAKMIKGSSLKIRSLQALAASYQMQLIDVKHDGNCFYSAIAEGLNITGGQQAVRDEVAKDMLNHREAREQHLSTYQISFEETLNSINSREQWASHAEILMTIYALKINLVIICPSFNRPHVIAQDSQNKTVVLAYYENFHYALLTGNIPDTIQKLLQAEWQQNANQLSP
jgi:hypothetical protein